MDRMKAVLTMAAAVLFAASPFFAGSFGGYDPNQFPVPQVDPPIVPAGYAFAIWGLIYVYLLVHAGFGLLKRDTDSRWDAARWPLIVSLTVGASWISVAKFSPMWATILIWVMLLTALVAVFRVLGAKDRWLLQTPLAIYAGWLTAASFVSLGLVGAGFGLITDQFGWAWTIQIVALIAAGLIQLRLARIPEYGLTVCWAFIAIAVRNFGSDPSLSVLALGGATALGLVAFYAWNTARESTSAGVR